MANYDATSGSYTTRLTVTETGTNTANNTSTVQFSLTLIKNSGYGLWNNNSCSWSININGTSYSGTFTYDFRNYSSLTLKSSTNQTVTHNGDGTKSISVSASVNMDNTPYVYTMSPSGTLTLTTIPRASDVTVSNYSITNTTGSLSATITSKANFYHKWRWQMNSGTWSSWTNKGLISTTSSTVTVANTTLLAKLPTATSGSFNIEVATYSDSGYSNHVGTKSATCTVSVNTSNIKPSVSLGNIGLNSTPISGYAVAGYSKVQSAWTTTNSSGATSVTTYFTVSTGSLATTSSSSTSGTVVSNVIPSNASNYTLTIYAYAKDSRGAVGATVSKSITVYGYQPPTANLTAYRTSSSSSTSEDGAGTYAYVTFSGAVRSSVNSQNSIQSTSCTYSGSISGTATNGGHYALADTQTVTFRLTVTDKVTSSTAQKTISTASYPLDLYDNGGGSVGVGFGAVANGGWLTSGLKNDLSRGNKTRVGIQTAYESTNSTSGTGFMIIATIKPKGAYDNKAITFKILRRGINHPSNVSIRFDGANSTDPGLASFVADFNSTDFYLYKSATSTWQLISYKTNYDQISILALYADDYVLSLNDIDTTQSVISAVPSGATQATQWSFPLATTATSATDSTNVSVVNKNVTAIESFYGAWVNNLSTSHQKIFANDGFTYRTLQGTSSAEGFSILQLGNYIANGTAGNKTGGLRIYSNGTSYTEVRSQASSTGYIAYLPVLKSASGYLQSSSVTWSGSLLGGQSITLTNGADFSRLKLFAFMGGTVNMIWEVDVGYITTSSRQFGHGELIWISDPGGWYMSHAEVTMTKSGNNIVVNFANARNIRVDGTNHVVKQNGNSNYKIYKIEGMY